MEGHDCTHNFGPVQKLPKTIIDFFRWKSITIQLCCYFQFYLQCTDNCWRCKIVRSPFEIHANSAINPQKPGIFDSLVALLMRSNILHNMHRCRRRTRNAEFINWKRGTITILCLWVFVRLIGCSSQWLGCWRLIFRSLKISGNFWEGQIFPRQRLRW